MADITKLIIFSNGVLISAKSDRGVKIEHIGKTSSRALKIVNPYSFFIPYVRFSIFV